MKIYIVIQVIHAHEARYEAIARTGPYNTGPIAGAFQIRAEAETAANALGYGYEVMEVWVE